MSPMEPLAVRADPPAVVDVPPAHLELTWRPLRLADATAVHELVGAIEEADDAPERESAESVQHRLSRAWVDLHRDSLAGFDTAGTMRAYGLVEVRPGDSRTIRAFLTGGVHPLWRGRGLGRAVLAWMEGRGRQKLVEQGKERPARLAVHVDQAARDQRRLYAAAGFSPIRWYSSMRRALSEPIPQVEPTAEVRIVPWSEDLDDAVRTAHNDAFADHWGSEPHTPETWRAHVRHVVAGWSFVALDPADDEVVGYLLAQRHGHHRVAAGNLCGYVDLLGVRPAWRGRRVAPSLLVRSMSAMRDDGVEEVCLSVDTANSAAVRALYEPLGFETTHGQVLYSVEL